MAQLLSFRPVDRYLAVQRRSQTENTAYMGASLSYFDHVDGSGGPAPLPRNPLGAHPRGENLRVKAWAFGVGNDNQRTIRVPEPAPRQRRGQTRGQTAVPIRVQAATGENPLYFHIR